MEQVVEKDEKVSDEHSLLKRQNGVKGVKKRLNYVKMAELRELSPDRTWPESPDPKASVDNFDSKRQWEGRMQAWVEEIRVASKNPEGKGEPVWVRRAALAQSQTDRPNSDVAVPSGEIVSGRAAEIRTDWTEGNQ